MQYVKREFKNLADHLKTNVSGLYNLTEVPKRKAIEKALKQAYDPNLFTQHVYPRNQAWTDLLTTPQLFAYNDKYTQVGPTFMGAMEAFATLDGDAIVAGVPYERIPGATLKDKRNLILNMPIDSVADAIKSGGFITKMDCSAVVVLPTGFIFLFASQGCRGLRWTLNSDAGDKERNIMMLKKILECYPELSNASRGYMQYQQYLEVM